MAIRRTMPDVWQGRGISHPLREMHRLQRRMDRMFEGLMSDPFSSSLVPTLSVAPMIGIEEMGFMPACDLEETESQYLVNFDLPGVKKDQVKVEVRDNHLTISGERKEEHKIEKANRLSEERIYGSFMRHFTLPSNVDAEHVEASFENGVLRVAIPKAEGTKPKQIPIREGIKEGKEEKRIEGKAA